MYSSIVLLMLTDILIDFHDTLQEIGVVAARGLLVGLLVRCNVLVFICFACVSGVHERTEVVLSLQVTGDFGVYFQLTLVCFLPLLVS